MNLNSLTIKQARQGLRAKQFSSLELVETHLTEIEKRNKSLNAFLTVCSNEALAKARKADELIKDGQNFPLLGIPIAAKDIFSTKGLKTTAASKVLEDYIPQYNATVIERLQSAGAIIVGKTNMDAWAHGSSGENSDFGPVKNPWNEQYVPGGSSSGSAVSVTSGMAMAATGTDTGGSIRLPASFTNTVGLKPTYGRVSRYGIIAMASSLDSIGHFTKTVEDSALLLRITAGRDKLDATTPPEIVPNYFNSLSNGVKGLKIGVPKEYVLGLESEISNNFNGSLKILKKLGAEIIEISLPSTEYGIACYYIIQPAEVSSNLARYDGIRYGNDRSFFGDEAKRRIMLGTFTLSVGYYEAYYKKAMKIRTLIVNDFENAFTKVDAIISPVSPTKPWKIGEKVNDPLKMYLSDALTVNANLAGIPGLSVPSGFIQGLPVGVQFLGAKFSEALLFRIGYAFEQETKFYQKAPYEL
ncbi:MAG: Asp-tRNA(Asn)/Glu-tRNA(Gln) amidotransferase subunit GatA [Candidatus Levyibacteriota bacterium]